MFEQKIVRNYVAICIFSRAGWSSSGLRTSPTVRWLVCVRPTCAWAATSSSAWWPTSSSPTTPPSPPRLAGSPSGPTPCTTGTVGVLQAYPLEYTAGIHYNSGPYSLPVLHIWKNHPFCQLCGAGVVKFIFGFRAPKTVPGFLVLVQYSLLFNCYGYTSSRVANWNIIGSKLAPYCNWIMPFLLIKRNI